MERGDGEMQEAPRTPRNAAPEVPSPRGPSQLGAKTLPSQQRRQPPGHPHTQSPPRRHDDPAARA
eukprot:8826744-Pyramimonas_sp.AAC.1